MYLNNMNGRTLIRERIKEILEQLEPVELALTLSWMKEKGYLTCFPDVMPTEDKRRDFVFLKGRIRDNLDGLDSKQLAETLSWMKSVEMYTYGAPMFDKRTTAEIVKSVFTKED